MERKNGVYWIKWDSQNSIKTGLYYVDWSFNSVGQIELSSIGLRPFLIDNDWVVKSIEVKNPFK